MLSIKIILSIMVAYFAGNIQTSLIISKIKKDDIRTHGSGNAGATNMLRTYGLKIGLLTFLCDFFKAFIAIAFAWWVIPCLPGTITSFYRDMCLYLAGFFVVLGHNFPIFFGFRGGKGVATSFAVIWAIFGICTGDWIVPILTTVLGIGMIFVTKMVSIGSLTGAVTAFVSVLIVCGSRSNAGACIFAFVLFSLIFLRHIKNIVRIMHGEEKKLSIGKKKEKA